MFLTSLIGAQCDGVKVKMGEVEKRLGEEVRRRGCAEELCNEQQNQLEKARDDALSLQRSILSLTQQASLPIRLFSVLSFAPFYTV